MKTYSYDQALEASIEYFNGDELAAKVFLDKYALRDNEQRLLEKTPRDMHERIARELHRIEVKKFKEPISYETIFSYLDGFKKIVPQGSPMYGIGNPYQYVSLSNCYLLESPTDSYGGILLTDEQLVQASKRRGGCGIDISNLRPIGTPTRNAARTSTGIIPFMERYSNSIREVGQCLHKDTIVIAPLGLRPIKLVTVGDQVWTENGWAVVEGILKNKKRLLQVSMVSGHEVNCSADHVFHTINGERYAYELSSGDIVTRIVGDGWFGEDVKLEVNGFGTGRSDDTAILPFVIDTKMAYLLGYMYGNGYVEEASITLAVPSAYHAIQQKLIEYCKEVFNYHINPRKGAGECFKFSINSSKIIRYLKHNKLLKQKSTEIIFPKKILRTKPDVVAAFISGFFDSDGCNQRSKKVYKFSSTSLKFQRCLQLVLSAFGVPSRIHSNKRDNGWHDIHNTTINGQLSQRRLYDFLSESIKMRMSPPNNKKRDFLRTTHTIRDYGSNSSKHSYIAGNKQWLTFSTTQRVCQDLGLEHKVRLLQDEIKGVYDLGEELYDTYDLILDHTNFFSANGMYVHNSGRRGALLVSLDVHHPQVLDFVESKKDLTKITGANISVRLSDEFLSAVEKGEDYEQRWPVDSQSPTISRKVSARKVWKRIIEMARETSEPGLLFWSTVLRETPSDCYEEQGFRSCGTNPCLSGETLVYVADGRGNVPIELLAKEGVDIPVFCFDNDNRVVIRTMRHPRKTGEKEQIYKVTLSDGSIIRVTGNHKFLKLNQEYVDVCNLKPGDSLKIITRLESSVNTMRKSKNRGGYSSALSKIVSVVSGVDTRLLKTLNGAIKDGYESKIVGNDIIVKRNCEQCSSEFYVNYSLREVSFCSRRCSNYYLNANHKRVLTINKTRASSMRDHKVIKIELDGVDDVYNGTVDDFHNFFVGAFEGRTKDGKPKFTYLNNRQCGEIILNQCDSCRLFVINLYGYVKNPFTQHALFDYEEFYKDSQVLQRFMDDVVDLELECIDRILNKIKEDPELPDVKSRETDFWLKVRRTCRVGRRTGSGITALGDVLAALGIKYGSEESISITDKIYKTLKLGCYRASVDMAKEKGAFSIWNADQEKDCPFLLRIKEEDQVLYEDMQKYGRRNIALLTTAPTGSVSIEAQTTSGIEPVFMLKYTRRKKVNPSDVNARVDFMDQNGDSWQEFTVYHPKIDEWMKITGETDVTKSPYYGCTADELDWKMRVKLQAAAQKHICHSISSTLNLPEDVSVEKVAEIYETAWKAGCKGITIYRKNSRSGVLIDDTSKRGKKISKTEAPKRLKAMSCDIHHVKTKRGNYTVLVGLLENDPYEIFAIPSNGIDKDAEKGVISKLKRGHYKLDIIDHNAKGQVVQSIETLCEDEEGALTRMTSTALRHGADISYIVQQLEKVKGDMFGLAKCMARSLKKYIKDGTKVTGEVCSGCGREDGLQRESGCVTCRNCGYSKCS